MRRRIGQRISARLQRSDGEAGVSLAELLVAVTVLAIGVAGLLQGVVGGLTLARTNEARAVAANVADERMSYLRSMEFADIPTGQTVATVNRGGRDYDITQDAQYVTVSSADSPCDSPGGTPAYLRVSLRVSWPDMESVRPVEADTVINPPVAAYDPYRGHLSVKVTDRDTLPSSGIKVAVTGIGSGTSNPGPQLTTSSGCAFFANLEPGDYEVSVEQTGHVDRQSVAVPVEPVTIGVAETQGLEFNYDAGAFVELTSPAGAMPTTVTSPALTTNDVPISIFNNNHDTTGPWVHASATALAGVPVYPYDSGWDVWAGCEEHGPTTENAADWLRAPVDPGQTTQVPLPTAQIRVTVNDGTGPVGGATLALVGTCTLDGVEEALTLEYDTDADGDGVHEVAVPAGPWRVEVVGAVADGAWPTVELTPASAPDLSVVIQ